ncbi:MAG: cation:proton antiporter [Phycisphaerales bacterium]
MIDFVDPTTPVWPVYVLAAKDGGAGGNLRVLGGVLLILGLGLLATSKTFYRFRRYHLFARLISSGWPAIGVGILLGPAGFRVLDENIILQVRPLLIVGLGWIGAIVGMQARRELIARIPGVVWKWLVVDAIVTAVVFGVATAFIVSSWIVHDGAAWIVAPVGMIVAASIGWAAETRSLMSDRGQEELRLAAVIQGSAGLAAIVSIFVFGLVSTGAHPNASDDAAFVIPQAALRLIASVVLAVGIGFVGRYLLRQVGRSRPDMLVIFFSMVTIVAGVAAELNFSPLFSAMLAGLVIANLGGTKLREFERFILGAEQTAGTIFGLLAGILVIPSIGGWGWLLVAMITTARLSCKPLLTRFTLRRSPELLPAKSSLYVAPIRQSLVAVAIAVSLVVSDASLFNRRLLTVIVMVALLSEILPFVLTFVGGVRPAPFSRADAPAPEENPDETLSSPKGAARA